MSFFKKIWQTCPLLASALVMAAGAFSINCGMAGPDPQLPLPETFQTTWLRKPIALRDGGSVRCFVVEGCVNYWCAGSCTIFTADAQEPSGIARASYNSCNFQQELSDAGDSLVLSCENCGPNGEDLELFRVDSNEELDGSETLVSDRNEPEKSVERLDTSGFSRCEDYLKSQPLSPAEP